MFKWELSDSEQSAQRKFALCFAIAWVCVLISILYAHFSQIPPCNLCLMQRRLYIGLGILTLIGGCLCHKTFVLWLVRALLAVLIGVATYHFALQMGWIVHQCKLPPNINTLEELQALGDTPLCSAEGLEIFGIPGSLFNIIIGVVLLLFTLLRHHPNAQKKTKIGP